MLSLSTVNSITKEFISKTPSPLPSPSRGGDEGEGDVCGLLMNSLVNAQP